jgi:hypothetical protein
VKGTLKVDASRRSDIAVVVLDAAAGVTPAKALTPERRRDNTQDYRAGMTTSHRWGSPSQQPSLRRQRGHCQVPWRQSIAALHRRQRSTATSFSMA